MKEQILNYVQIAIGLIITGALGAVFNRLKKSKWAKFYPLIESAVYWAENEFGSGKGVEKRTAVENYIVGLLGNKITVDELDKMIGSAVGKLNSVMKSQSTAFNPVINVATQTIPVSTPEVTPLEQTPRVTPEVAPTPEPQPVADQAPLQEVTPQAVTLHVNLTPDQVAAIAGAQNGQI